MIVYCISGLGADERVFSRLRLKGEIRFIHWIPPQPQETLQHYVARLADQIDASQPFALLGVSFGGVVARELAQLLPPQALIVISSFSRAHQLPSAHFSYLLPLLMIVPNKLLTPPRRLMCWLFGIRVQAHKELFYQILQDTDPVFLRWSLSVLLKIRTLSPVAGLVQIHGQADRIIPYSKTKDVIMLADAGHFAIYTHALEISSIVNKLLFKS